ncbi:GntR family transcriptional regulator [Streptomyces sp. NPDC057654]|uniref:GntR family transcriptional regulator n=1 Tax=Streptomyces sp. NPDC057654 TaxID=3346196 RepID=UPI0036A3D63E
MAAPTAGPALAKAEIVTKLRQGIADGTYPASTRLPSIKSLAAEFGVSYHTTHAAVHDLAEEGLVDPLRGSQGTIVVAPDESPAFQRRAATAAAQLRQDIADGTYPAGTWLPSRAELAAKLGVGVTVYGAATRILAKEGLVHSRHGQGTFVLPPDETRSGPVTQRDLVAARLRQDIADGTYPAGSLLPSRLDLAAKCNTSYQTCRQAVRALAEEGLVSPHSGPAVVVLAPGETPRPVLSASQQRELVAARLRQDIADGTYPAGSLLPSRLDLAAKLKVTPLACREAVHVLTAEGSVAVYNGRGTVVLAPGEAPGPTAMPPNLQERIFRKLRDAIQSGTYPPGSVFPTIMQLAQQFGVSSRIAHGAQRRLREAGLIAGPKGHQALVCSPKDAAQC